MRGVLGLLVGLVLAVACANQCDDAVGCDACRSCASQPRGACIVAWRACSADPFCSDLVGCIDDCYLELKGGAAVDCERTCRGHIGGKAVDVYDEWSMCVDDACTLDCD